MEDKSKSVFKSKTVWFNAVIAAAGVFATAGAFPIDIIPADATPVAIALAISNIAMRILSKTKIKL